MATTIYLDPDDEITTAAARIRQATDSRVAIVIPSGSRVATSRINFRLLAREATVNGRRLDIVAPDASARALAASAGLPVFGSVGEYEDALAGPAVAAVEATDDLPARPQVGRRRRGADGRRPSAVAEPDSAAVGSPRSAPGAGGSGSDVTERPADREAELDAIVRRSREVPVVRPPRRLPGAGLVAGIGILVVGLAVAGVAASLFLPAADITIAPRVEAVGPLELVVTADPAATAVDPDTLVIPAQTVAFPVEVATQFPATGKRVESTPATGGVRWRNCDPSASYSVAAGTSVRTPDGIEFTIDEAVFLPVAQITGTGSVQTIRCQTTEVAVTAAKPGPEGNVEAGRIRVVPARYDRNLVTVTNPDPTTGGTREEFTRISRKDIDAALATLATDLQARFEAQMEDPSEIPFPGLAFPATAVLGESAPTVDPESLLSVEVETFQLGLSATATMLAVDTSPIHDIAAAALADAVTPGWTLVEGSSRLSVGEGAVRRGVIEFPVAGVAKQVRPVDGDLLRGQVMGLPADQARAILEPYGEVTIALWPDMVTAVPTIDQRVTLSVLDPIDTVPDVDPVLPSSRPEPSPSAAPDGGSPSQPVPSG